MNPKEISLTRIACTSIRLDKGEGLDYMEKMMVRMAAKGVQAFFIDFIFPPDGRKEALVLVDGFYLLCDELMPGLSAGVKFVGLTSDANSRPAAMALILFTENTEATVNDVNPERDQLWNQ